LTSAGNAFAQTLPQGAPQCGQNHPRVTPSEQQLYSRLMRRFASLGLTPQQQSQIQALIGQYSQAHPAGSPLDMEANRQLRQSILAVLTPQQVEAYRQERQQQRSEAPQHQRCP
jgi:hypothetical protein